MAGTKLVLCGLVALSALSACGGSDKESAVGTPATTQCAPGQYFDGRVCQSQSGTPVATATPAATVPGAAPAATAPAIPGLPGIATTSAGPTATPLESRDRAGRYVVDCAAGRHRGRPGRQGRGRCDRR